MQTTKKGAMQTILETIYAYHFESIIIQGENVTYTIDRLDDNTNYKGEGYRPPTFMIAKYVAGEDYHPTDLKDVKTFVTSGQAKKLIMK